VIGITILHFLLKCKRVGEITGTQFMLLLRLPNKEYNGVVKQIQ